MNGMESNHRHTLAAPRVSGPTRPRVTTRQITHTRVPSRHPLRLSSTSHDSSNHPHPRAVAPPPRRLSSDASTSRASIDRVARRVAPSSSSTASASTARTNTRMKIHTSRRRRAFEHRDVDRARTREKRSDDRPTLDRRFARSTRRPEGRIGDRATRIARERCARIRCERLEANDIDANERIDSMGSIGSTRRVVSRPRLANECANE